MHRLCWIFLLLFPTATLAQQQVVAYRYWFDQGSPGSPVSVAASATAAITAAIPTQSLPPGFHTLHMQARDNYGKWSSVYSRSFYRLQGSNAVSDIQYWVDEDVAQASTQNAPANSGTIFLDQAWPLGSLSTGFHMFHVRFRQSSGTWGAVTSKPFLKLQSPFNSITQYQYWIDDPSGQAPVISASASSEILFLNEQLNFSTLQPGLHVLHVRFRQATGAWGAVSSYAFYYLGAGKNIAAYRYWFDEFDILTNTVPLTTPVSPLELLAQVDVSSLNPGVHQVHMQFQDVAGQWSSVKTNTFHHGGVTNANIHPHITLSPGYLSAGQAVDISGSYFTVGEGVKLFIFGPQDYLEIVGLNANGQGLFNNMLSTTGLLPGTYDVLAIDSVANKYAPLRSFTISATPGFVPTVDLYAPDPDISLYAGAPIHVSWTDILNKGNAYPMTGAQRHYAYELAYSADGGSSWQTVTTVSGMDDVYEQIFLSANLVLPTSGTNYKLRIRDTFVPANYDESDLLTVHPAVASNINMDLIWDYSYPGRNGPLLGVAAEGTSRIYLAISRKNPAIGPGISSVSVSLQDGVNTTPKKLGKVMPATETKTYSSEANAAHQTTTSSATVVNDTVWFWYVAPDDFVGENSGDSAATRRLVHAGLTIQFSDNSSLNRSKEIEVVRPPLMLVHGLGGNPRTWDNFYSDNPLCSCPFIRDPRFLIAKAIKLQNPGGSFDLNASFLTIGLGEASPDFAHSFAGVVKSLRDRGYASNQVDYIAHSMGGVVLRYAMSAYTDYFFRTGIAANRNYKNYEAGYVNKLTTIASPHNSSPFADIVGRHAPDLPLKARALIQLLYNYFPNSLAFSIITQDDPNKLVPVWKMTDAVRNLQIDEGKGGINFPATPINAHLIASDLFPGVSGTTNLIPQEIVDIVSKSRIQVSFLNHFLKVAIAGEQNPALVAELSNALKIPNEVARALKYIEIMIDVINVAAFIPESDLIVSVESQLAGLPRSAPNTTVFDGLFHAAISPKETESILVGNKVNQILNSSLTTPGLFGSIPATSNKSQNSLDDRLGSFDLLSISSVSDTNKMIIRSPTDHLAVTAEDLLSLTIQLKDTVGLINLEVWIQNQAYILDARDPLIHLTTQVNSSLLDTQRVFVEAFYRYADSSLLVYDEVLIDVKTESAYLGFAAEPSIMYLRKGESQFAEYTAYFHDFTTARANFSPAIAASVENPAIVAFDTLTKGFTGLSDGETFAVVSYRNLSDTIYFVVEGQLDTTLTALDDPLDFSSAFPGYSFNYPNPFSTTTRIDYEVSRPGEVRLEVFSINGTKVHQSEVYAATVGKHTTTFDGSKLPPGVYPFLLTTPSGAFRGKLVIIR